TKSRVSIEDLHEALAQKFRKDLILTPTQVGIICDRIHDISKAMLEFTAVRQSTVEAPTYRTQIVAARLSESVEAKQIEFDHNVIAINEIVVKPNYKRIFEMFLRNS